MLIDFITRVTNLSHIDTQNGVLHFQKKYPYLNKLSFWEYKSWHLTLLDEIGTYIYTIDHNKTLDLYLTPNKEYSIWELLGVYIGAEKHEIIGSKVRYKLSLGQSALNGSTLPYLERLFQPYVKYNIDTDWACLVDIDDELKLSFYVTMPD